MHILQHEAEESADVSQIELPDVDAVDRDAAALHVIEPQQQIDQRRLARPRRADDADALSRAYFETHVAQHPFGLGVGTTSVPARDLRPRARGRRSSGGTEVARGDG